MSIKKMLLLAGMALAVVALAGPASASAEPLTWLDNHEVLGAEEHATEEYEGPARFFGAGEDSFGCEVTVVLTAEGGHTGTITKFEPTTETCTGTGAFAGCELANHSASTPWDVDVTTTDLVVTDVTIHNEYDEACAVETTHLEFPELTAVPDENTTISTLTVSGFATSGAFGFGELHAETGGTIGIG